MSPMRRVGLCCGSGRGSDSGHAVMTQGTLRISLTTPTYPMTNLRPVGHGTRTVEPPGLHGSNSPTDTKGPFRGPFLLPAGTAGFATSQRTNTPAQFLAMVRGVRQPRHTILGTWPCYATQGPDPQSLSKRKRAGMSRPYWECEASHNRTNCCQSNPMHQHVNAEPPFAPCADIDQASLETVRCNDPNGKENAASRPCDEAFQFSDQSRGNQSLRLIDT